MPRWPRRATVSNKRADFMSRELRDAFRAIGFEDGPRHHYAMVFLTGVQRPGKTGQERARRLPTFER